MCKMVFRLSAVLACSFGMSESSTAFFMASICCNAFDISKFVCILLDLFLLSFIIIIIHLKTELFIHKAISNSIFYYYYYYRILHLFFVVVVVDDDLESYVWSIIHLYARTHTHIFTHSHKFILFNYIFSPNIRRLFHLIFLLCLFFVFLFSINFSEYLFVFIMI